MIFITLQILAPILIVLSILFYIIWRKQEHPIYGKLYRLCRNMALVFLVLNFLYSIMGIIPGCPQGTYKGLITISSYQYRPASDNSNEVIVDVNYIFEPQNPGSYFVSHEGDHQRDFFALYYWIQNSYTYIKYSKLMSYLVNPPRKIVYEVSYTFSEADFKKYMAQKQFDSKDTKETTIDETLPGGCLPYIGIDAFEFSSAPLKGQLIKRAVKPNYEN